MSTLDTGQARAPENEQRLCGASDGSQWGRTCAKPAGHQPHNGGGVTWVTEEAVACPSCGGDVWVQQTVAEALRIIRESVPADTVIVVCGDDLQVTSQVRYPTGTHQITCKPRQQDGAPT